jgi:hypothetical protein
MEIKDIKECFGVEASIYCRAIERCEWLLRVIRRCCVWVSRYIVLGPIIIDIVSVLSNEQYMTRDDYFSVSLGSGIPLKPASRTLCT